MNNEFFKKNLTTILMVGATVLLGGVAVFTAVRLYQLRSEPVAPNAPQSEPEAANEGVIIDIPITTRKSGPGDHLLASQDVTQYSGLTCTVSAQAENQSSVHPGNDLTVESGGDSVVLEDVEGVAGGSTSASGTLVLGNTVTVTLNMGPDNSFSAGMNVSLDCDTSTPPPTPEPQACTELVFSISTPTGTPTSTPTTTPTTTPTATPTPKACNVTCSTSAECGNGYTCIDKQDGTGTKACRLSTNPTSATCQARGCNQSCGESSDCESGLTCLDTGGGVRRCRDADYPTSSTCTATTNTPTSTSTSTPASLPAAGVSTPTLIGIAAGILLLVGAFVLAL